MQNGLAILRKYSLMILLLFVTTAVFSQTEIGVQFYTFRNQFASTVQANRNNLDAAIKTFIPTASATGQP